MRAEHEHYLAACGRLSASEIALILRLDKDWTLPRGQGVARRMAEAKQLIEGIQMGDDTRPIDEPIPAGPAPIRERAIVASDPAPNYHPGGWRRRADVPSPWGADGKPIRAARHEFGEGGTSPTMNLPRGRRRRTPFARPASPVDQPSPATPEVVHAPPAVEPVIAELSGASGPDEPPAAESGPPSIAVTVAAVDVEPQPHPEPVAASAPGAIRDLWTGDIYANAVEAADGTGKTLGAVQQAVKLSRRGARVRFAGARDLEAEASRIPPGWTREGELAAIASRDQKGAA